MPGLASEAPVVLSAGVGLLAFVGYFASILFAVPKHWGVPYKSRLARYVSQSRPGLAVEAVNAAFSLVRTPVVLSCSVDPRMFVSWLFFSCGVVCRSLAGV